MRCFIFQTAPLIHVIALETQRKALGMFCLWEQVHLFNYAEMWFLHNCGSKKKKKKKKKPHLMSEKNWGKPNVAEQWRTMERLWHTGCSRSWASQRGAIWCVIPPRAIRRRPNQCHPAAHLIDKARSPREVAALRPCTKTRTAHGSRTPPHSDPQDLARGYQADTDS